MIINNEAVMPNAAAAEERSFNKIILETIPILGKQHKKISVYLGRKYIAGWISEHKNKALAISPDDCLIKINSVMKPYQNATTITIHVNIEQYQALHE